MWNINGLIRKLTDADFVEYTRSYIILLCETWISDKNTIDLDIQGYDSTHIFGQKTIGVKKGR